MPYLKVILDNKNCMLKAQAMEFICSVGMTVRKDKFRDNSKQVSLTFTFIFVNYGAKCPSYLDIYLIRQEVSNAIVFLCGFRWRKFLCTWKEL